MLKARTAQLTPVIYRPSFPYLPLIQNFPHFLESHAGSIHLKEKVTAWTHLTFYLLPLLPTFSSTLEPLRLWCRVASLSLFICDFHHRCSKILHIASHLYYLYLSNLEEQKENTATVKMSNPKLSPHENSLYLHYWFMK